ncbi:MAG TPA: thiamine-phosphate kinase [Candidatus Agrococcus pullicola]|uniref:Thiamine-monophosphate kinase n=1 Tax=Candidatus Agrococcus pullicola TaxID=2838429 RepID=A0A9D1YYE7_9MICO|nr:thiamine-phosphate kinase [Candidatus Agrococcus pullicola]
MASIAELGERGALERFLPHLTQSENVLVGPGDDAAVLRSGGELVVTTDTMFEGADFRHDWSTFADLGTKAVTTNLTDIAAMGATPTGLVIALGVPGRIDVRNLEEFAKAADRTLQKLAPGAGVVGGDLSTSERTVISVTAFGDMRGRSPVLRSGARADDRIVVAGELGMSGAGLALLSAGEHPVDELRRRHPQRIEAHVAPLAPVHLGSALADAGATSMLDVSDGLVLDAGRIARASGVELRFDRAALEAFDADLEHVLYGGEDHALLATLPQEATLPDGVLVIGEVRESEAGVTLDGEPVQERGWDPFRR